MVAAKKTVRVMQGDSRCSLHHVAHQTIVESREAMAKKIAVMLSVVALGGLVGCGEAPQGEESLGESQQRVDVVEHCDYSATTPPVFDPYPGRSVSATGSAASYPWSTFTFNGYTGGMIETQNGSTDVASLDVTSGDLRATNDPSTTGRTTDNVFRMLAEKLNGGARVSWDTMSVKSTFYVEQWNTLPPGSDVEWLGLHLFARYQTEYDLYVASLRSNGDIYIKRKLCGSYVKIASHTARFESDGTAMFPNGVPTGQWIDIEFSVAGNTAVFKINGNKQFRLSRYNVGNVDLTVPFTSTNPENPLQVIPGGTGGIRTDYANVRFENWSIQ